MQGVTTRNEFHRSPDERAEGEFVGLPFPEWLLGFDAEKNAQEVYNEVAKHIEGQGYRPPSEGILECCKSD